MVNDVEQALERKGWVRARDGSWSRPPRRAVGQVEANRAEPATVPALDRGEQVKQGGEARLGRRVTMVSLRRRLLDPDAVSFSLKALTDAVALTLGVDDADPSVEWEWSQTKTEGEEGVIVKVERLNK